MVRGRVPNRAGVQEGVGSFVDKLMDELDTNQDGIVYATLLSTFVKPLPTFVNLLSTFVKPLPTFVKPLPTFVKPLSTFVKPLPTFVNLLSTFVKPLPTLCHTFAKPLSAFVKPLSTFVTTLSTFVGATLTHLVRWSVLFWQRHANTFASSPFCHTTFFLFSS